MSRNCQLCLLFLRWKLPWPTGWRARSCTRPQALTPTESGLKHSPVMLIQNIYGLRAWLLMVIAWRRDKKINFSFICRYRLLSSASMVEILLLLITPGRMNIGPQPAHLRQLCQLDAGFLLFSTVLSPIPASRASFFIQKWILCQYLILASIPNYIPSLRTLLSEKRLSMPDRVWDCPGYRRHYRIGPLNIMLSSFSSLDMVSGAMMLFFCCFRIPRHFWRCLACLTSLTFSGVTHMRGHGDAGFAETFC